VLPPVFPIIIVSVPDVFALSPIAIAPPEFTRVLKPIEIPNPADAPVVAPFPIAVL
jgi:hypothetical protein